MGPAGSRTRGTEGNGARVCEVAGARGAAEASLEVTPLSRLSGRGVLRVTPLAGGARGI